MILTIAKDILHGLQYLHSHDLAHRDLKVHALTAKAIASFHSCLAVHSGAHSLATALCGTVLPLLKQDPSRKDRGSQMVMPSILRVIQSML